MEWVLNIFYNRLYGKQLINAYAYDVQIILTINDYNITLSKLTFTIVIIPAISFWRF